MKITGNKYEKILLYGWIIAIVVMITGPYLYGYVKECPADMKFLGFISPNGNDQAFYLGWGPKQAEQGHFLFEDKYNGYTEKRQVFNLLWLIMGQSAKVFNINVITVFHIERVLASVFLLLIIYKIISIFIADPLWRFYCLVLVSVSSGFGFFLRPVFGLITPDTWVIESNTFLIMRGETVLPLATALLCLAIYFGYKTFYEDRKFALKTGFVVLILGTVHPYSVISVYCILGVVAVYKIMENKSWKIHIADYLKIFLPALPMILYDWYLVLHDPRLVAGQPQTPSPDIIRYFLGYGIVSVFSLIGIILILVKKRSEFYFLLIWVFTTFCIIYVPLSVFPFQLQLILGVQIPLVITAVIGITEIYKYMYAARAPQFLSISLLLIIFVLSAITNIQFFRYQFHKMDSYSLPEYIDIKTKKAIDWLSENTKDSEVVISSPEVAPYIPVLANNRMYCGDYWGPTAEYYEKEKKINWLFSADINKTDQEMIDYLKLSSIDYVFYDRNLRKKGGETTANRLLSLPGIERNYVNDVVTIFKFNKIP